MPEHPLDCADCPTELSTASWDVDPLDRSKDRLLAAMGLLEDAVPLFAHADSLPRAAVLLAVPSLVASGVLSIARKLYGTIGPAFYGLRTTLVSYILLALLRIPRPENLKEYAPGGLGRIVGLDRLPEVKTLRRKLASLASRKASQQFGRGPSSYRGAGPVVWVPLYRWSCSDLPWQTHDRERLGHPYPLGGSGDDRLLGQ